MGSARERCSPRAHGSRDPLLEFPGTSARARRGQASCRHGNGQPVQVRASWRPVSDVEIESLLPERNAFERGVAAYCRLAEAHGGKAPWALAVLAVAPASSSRGCAPR